VKLGLLVRTLGTDGGTERFVHGFARWLLAHDQAVRVLAVAAPQPVDGAEVELLPVHARGRARKLSALASAAAGIERRDLDVLLGFVRAGRPDIYRAGGGSHRAWMARLGRPALDLLGRSGDAVEARLDDAVLAAARVVVANSQLALDDLVAYSAVPREKLVLVRNGVDLRRFRPQALPRLLPAPTALFLGNGWARKNLAAALHALSLLPDLHLAVAGGERRPGRWRKLARKLGVHDRVRWLGTVPRPEELLPRVDALVLPTRYDPCANACLEAMAAGLPVVTTATNGAHEVLPESWLTVQDPDDAPALATALERALLEEGLGARCRLAAEALPDHGAFAALFRIAQDLAPGAR